MNVLDKVSKIVTNIVISNIKLEDGVFLLQMKAAQEGKKATSEYLKKTPQGGQ